MLRFADAKRPRLSLNSLPKQGEPYMLNRKSHDTGRGFTKLFSRILCLVLLLLAITFLTVSPKAQGTRISCLFDEGLGDGTALYVSCGSSAGNFMGECGPHSGANGEMGCTLWDDPADNWLADQACADYQAHGCPTEGGGGGGIGGLIP